MKPAADARELPEGLQGHARVAPEGRRRSAATRVELASLDPSVPMDVYADGERVGPLPATMEAVPDALTVRVP